MAQVDATTNVGTDTKVSMRPPSKYNVILFNDDTTTVEFVILVLMRIFHKTIEEATEITMHIHHNGRGIAGTYGREVATQKRDETIAASQVNGYPLRCEMEEA